MRLACALLVAALASGCVATDRFDRPQRVELGAIDLEACVQLAGECARKHLEEVNEIIRGHGLDRRVSLADYSVYVAQYRREGRQEPVQELVFIYRITGLLPWRGAGNTFMVSVRTDSHAVRLSGGR